MCGECGKRNVIIFDDGQFKLYRGQIVLFSSYLLPFDIYHANQIVPTKQCQSNTTKFYFKLKWLSAIATHQLMDKKRQIVWELHSQHWTTAAGHQRQSYKFLLFIFQQWRFWHPCLSAAKKFCLFGAVLFLFIITGTTITSGYIFLPQLCTPLLTVGNCLICAHFDSFV